MVGGQQSYILPPPPSETQTGLAAASPLIVQVNQGPDVIAEVDSGHCTPWIGLTAVTNRDAEPAVGLEMCHLPHSHSHSQGRWLRCLWFQFLGGESSSFC